MLGRNIANIASYLRFSANSLGDDEVYDKTWTLRLIVFAHLLVLRFTTSLCGNEIEQLEQFDTILDTLAL